MSHVESNPTNMLGSIGFPKNLSALDISTSSSNLDESNLTSEFLQFHSPIAKTEDQGIHNTKAFSNDYHFESGSIIRKRNDNESLPRIVNGRSEENGEVSVLNEQDVTEFRGPIESADEYYLSSVQDQSRPYDEAFSSPGRLQVQQNRVFSQNTNQPNRRVRPSKVSASQSIVSPGSSATLDKDSFIIMPPTPMTSAAMKYPIGSPNMFGGENSETANFLFSDSPYGSGSTGEHLEDLACLLAEQSYQHGTDSTMMVHSVQSSQHKVVVEGQVSCAINLLDSRSQVHKLTEDHKVQYAHTHSLNSSGDNLIDKQESNIKAALAAQNQALRATQVSNLSNRREITATANEIADAFADETTTDLGTIPEHASLNSPLTEDEKVSILKSLETNENIGWNQTSNQTHTSNRVYLEDVLSSTDVTPELTSEKLQSHPSIASQNGQSRTSSIPQNAQPTDTSDHITTTITLAQSRRLWLERAERVAATPLRSALDRAEKLRFFPTNSFSDLFAPSPVAQSHSVFRSPVMLSPDRPTYVNTSVSSASSPSSTILSPISQHVVSGGLNNDRLISVYNQLLSPKVSSVTTTPTHKRIQGIAQRAANMFSPESVSESGSESENMTGSQKRMRLRSGYLKGRSSIKHESPQSTQPSSASKSVLHSIPGDSIQENEETSDMSDSNDAEESVSEAYTRAKKDLWSVVRSPPILSPLSSPPPPPLESEGDWPLSGDSPSSAGEADGILNKSQLFKETPLTCIEEHPSHEASPGYDQYDDLSSGNIWQKAHVPESRPFESLKKPVPLRQSDVELFAELNELENELLSLKISDKRTAWASSKNNVDEKNNLSRQRTKERANASDSLPFTSASSESLNSISLPSSHPAIASKVAQSKETNVKPQALHTNADNSANAAMNIQARVLKRAQDINAQVAQALAAKSNCDIKRDSSIQGTIVPVTENIPIMRYYLSNVQFIHRFYHFSARLDHHSPVSSDAMYREAAIQTLKHTLAHVLSFLENLCAEVYVSTQLDFGQEREMETATSEAFFQHPTLPIDAAQKDILLMERHVAGLSMRLFANFPQSNDAETFNFSLIIVTPRFCGLESPIELGSSRAMLLHIDPLHFVRAFRTAVALGKASNLPPDCIYEKTTNSCPILLSNFAITELLPIRYKEANQHQLVNHK